MSEQKNNERVNRKKLEHMERVRQKEVNKISKTRVKKLAKIVERKKVKDTRDALIENLMKYQLDSSFLKTLVSAKNQKPTETAESIENLPKKFPKKLRCVSGKEMEAGRPKRVQNNHYETDSSTDGSENDLFEAGAEVVETCMEPIQPPPKTNREESVRNPEATKTHEYVPIVQLEARQMELDRKKAEKESKTYFEALARIKGKQIPVLRLDAIEAQRSKLPIHAEEQQIVEAINENTVIIISGETGSGKTTQIPQFLYEAGYTSNGHLIGITEPRRIAAITMAARVGEELNNKALASYQIRFEGNRTDSTKILYMTDGVLLKELQNDYTLSKFSVIVIDEAHERSIYSDVLIGLLSRICVARLKRTFPLKLIIMSATLRKSDFMGKRLFPNINPKEIEVNSRQYPVTVHFEKKTPDDHLMAAFKKVCKIHERLPNGGILVFLSGQIEVEQLIKWLTIKYKRPILDVEEETKLKTQNLSRKRLNKKSKNREAKKAKTENNIENLKEEKDPEKEFNEDMIIDYEEFGGGDMDMTESVHNPNSMRQIPDELIMDENDAEEAGFAPLYCLPLYSLLPPEKQRLVFEPIPNGSRLCVIATNVAETSLTIPNIRYVIDSGKEKRRDFDPITGISQFNVGWISRASAEQRSGRAGRVQAGHAYRLYSSAVYEDLKKFAPPEILCKPIEQLVLHLKAMNFTKLNKFPFPTPPNEQQIRIAELSLMRLGALERRNEKADAQITELGRTLSQIPLSPQFAKLLVLSNQNDLFPFTIALVSALSVREPLQLISSIRETTIQDTQNEMTRVLKQRKAWCGFGEARLLGDLSVLLHVLGAADNEIRASRQYLEGLGLRLKAYNEIRKLRRQLTELVNSSSSVNKKIELEGKLKPPTQQQMKILRNLFASCLTEQIAKRVDRSVGNNEVPKGAYKCQKSEDFVFIDSTSMLYSQQPDYVLYQDIIQIGQKKCMQNLCVIEREWVPDYVEKIITSA